MQYKVNIIFIIIKKIILIFFLYFGIIESQAQPIWKEVYSEKFTYILQCITFPDSLNGYAVGQGGRIVKTVNGGNSWDTLVSCTKQTLLYT
jgi:hypothetical protein